MFSASCVIVYTKGSSARIIMISMFNKEWHGFSVCQYLFEMVAILFVTMKTGSGCMYVLLFLMCQSLVGIYSCCTFIICVLYLLAGIKICSVAAAYPNYGEEEGRWSILAAFNKTG